MFETSEPAARLVTGELAAFAGAMRTLDSDVDDAERVDQLRLLEELKGAVAAAQARVTTDFAASQERKQREAGVPARRVGSGIAAQVGLARRESPARAQRHLGWAKILTGELPGTLEQLASGQISEWRAQIVARETAWLSPLAPAGGRRGGCPAPGVLGRPAGGGRGEEAGLPVGPRGYLTRLSNATNDRTVTLRPAPDTMSYLTGLLPVAQGVAVLATLQRQADSLRSQGDDRSRGQIMADTLVERVTGQATAEAVPVEVNLLLAGQTGTDAAAQVWVRRLFTAPGTGQLAALDSRRRTFDGVLRRLLIARDQACRTPWCDAPIRHADHVTAVADDGRTEAGNGRGLCEGVQPRQTGTRLAGPRLRRRIGRGGRDHHPDRPHLPQQATRTTTHSPPTTPRPHLRRAPRQRRLTRAHAFGSATRRGGVRHDGPHPRGRPTA